MNNASAEKYHLNTQTMKPASLALRRCSECAKSKQQLGGKLLKLSYSVRRVWVCAECFKA